jgi:hypothetical protein
VKVKLHIAIEPTSIGFIWFYMVFKVNVTCGPYGMGWF